MDVKTELGKSANIENSRLSNIPNAKTQAAMRDANAWVVEMRAKESLCSQSNIGTLVNSENFTSNI